MLSRRQVRAMLSGEGIPTKSGSDYYGREKTSDWITHGNPLVDSNADSMKTDGQTSSSPSLSVARSLSLALFPLSFLCCVCTPSYVRPRVCAPHVADHLQMDSKAITKRQVLT